MSRRVLLGCCIGLVVHRPPAIAKERKKAGIIKAGSGAKGVEPPFAEIEKWLRSSKLQPISYTLVVLNKPAGPEALLFVYEKGAYMEVLQTPPQQLLDVLRSYIAKFKNAEGLVPKFYLLGVRIGGDYMARMSYDQDTFEGKANLSEISETEFADMAAKYQPPE